MGVNISAAAKEPVDVAAKAAPEFAQFTGNFKLTDTVSANYDLADLDFALSTSFGFGGHDACVAFRKV